MVDADDEALERSQACGTCQDAAQVDELRQWVEYGQWHDSAGHLTSTSKSSAPRRLFASTITGPSARPSHAGSGEEAPIDHEHAASSPKKKRDATARSRTSDDRERRSERARAPTPKSCPLPGCRSLTRWPHASSARSRSSWKHGRGSLAPPPPCATRQRFATAAPPPVTLAYARGT